MKMVMVIMKMMILMDTMLILHPSIQLYEVHDSVVIDEVNMIIQVNSNSPIHFLMFCFISDAEENDDNPTEEME